MAPRSFLLVGMLLRVALQLAFPNDFQHLVFLFWLRHADSVRSPRVASSARPSFRNEWGSSSFYCPPHRRRRVYQAFSSPLCPPLATLMTPPLSSWIYQIRGMDTHVRTRKGNATLVEATMDVYIFDLTRRSTSRRGCSTIHARNVGETALPFCEATAGSNWMPRYGRRIDQIKIAHGHLFQDAFPHYL